MKFIIYIGRTIVDLPEYQKFIWSNREHLICFHIIIILKTGFRALLPAIVHELSITHIILYNYMLPNNNEV